MHVYALALIESQNYKKIFNVFHKNFAETTSKTYDKAAK